MKKIAIVTGGTKGLGKEISLQLSDAGFKVYAVSRNPEKIGKNIVTESADITDEKQCSKLVKKVIKKEKRIDFLVNNAGVSKGTIQEMINLNLFGAVNIVNASYDYLKKSNGKIINITSLNALVPTPHAAEYSASKHALEAYFISLSYSSRKDLISVTNIATGAIYNPNGKKLKHKTLREKMPLLKYAFPMVTKERVADSVVKVANDTKFRKRIVLGTDAKIAYFISWRFPNIWFSILDRI